MKIMKAKFKVCKLYLDPVKTSEKKKYFVFPVSRGVKSLMALSEELGGGNSIRAQEMRSCFKMLMSLATFWMSKGYTINMDGLGSLSMVPTNIDSFSNDGGIEPSRVRFKKVKFKADIAMKRQLQTAEFERVYEDGVTIEVQSERFEIILRYLKENEFVSLAECMCLCHVSRATMVKDVETLIEMGSIKRLGKGANVIYCLKE